MSVPLDIADLIRTRLITAPAADEISTEVDLSALAAHVIVDRQKDLRAEVGKAVAKSRKGIAIVIIWAEYTPASDNTRRPRMEHSFNISCWSAPVLSAPALPVDDIMQSVIARLWHWIPIGRHAFGEMKIRSGGIVPDPDFLIYDLQVAIAATH